MTAEPSAHTDELADSIRRVCALLDNDSHVVARAAGLADTRELTVVEAVDDHPGRNQLALGRDLGIDKTTLVAVIDCLVDSGILIRETSRDDRRVRVPTLTARGRRMLRRARGHRSELTAERFAKLAPAQIASILEALHTIPD